MIVPFWMSDEVPMSQFAEMLRLLPLGIVHVASKLVECTVVTSPLHSVPLGRYSIWNDVFASFAL